MSRGKSNTRRKESALAVMLLTVVLGLSCVLAGCSQKTGPYTDAEAAVSAELDAIKAGNEYTFPAIEEPSGEGSEEASEEATGELTEKCRKSFSRNTRTSCVTSTMR